MKKNNSNHFPILMKRLAKQKKVLDYGPETFTETTQVLKFYYIKDTTGSFERVTGRDGREEGGGRKKEGGKEGAAVVIRGGGGGGDVGLILQVMGMAVMRGEEKYNVHSLAREEAVRGSEGQ